MLRTRSGYTGGSKEKPTYRSMGDHTEAISIDYDPKVISYDQLLTHFWDAHRCDRNNSSRQYMNAIFYQNDTQRKLAEASLVKRAQFLGISTDAVQTKILPVKEFTYAETYHQKYALTRHREARDFLLEKYPDGKSLADSTVATRLNAYLGSGMRKDWKQFLQELPKYGLPEKIEESLRKEAKRRL